MEEAWATVSHTSGTEVWKERDSWNMSSLVGVALQPTERGLQQGLEDLRGTPLKRRAGDPPSGGSSQGRLVHEAGGSRISSSSSRTGAPVSFQSGCAARIPCASGFTGSPDHHLVSSQIVQQGFPALQASPGHQGHQPVSSQVVQQGFQALQASPARNECSSRQFQAGFPQGQQVGGLPRYQQQEIQPQTVGFPGSQPSISTQGFPAQCPQPRQVGAQDQGSPIKQNNQWAHPPQPWGTLQDSFAFGFDGTAQASAQENTSV